jgi:hypothetical protein
MKSFRAATVRERVNVSHNINTGGFPKMRSLLLFALTMTIAVAQIQPDGKGDLVRDPLPQFQHEPDAAIDSAPNPYSVVQDGIQYHGGPVMTGVKDVYLIWYGKWTGNTAESILPALVTNLNGSKYFNINTTYTNGAGTKVANSIALIQQTTNNYSKGKSLTDADIVAIVNKAIFPNGVLLNDPNGVYFVLTSADVNETSGFCTSYCGWHNHTTIGGTVIKYAFVGNGDRCPSACQAQTISPNGNAGADGMASILSHELEETATDPRLNAWYQNSTTEENADKCAWKFGSEKTLPSGAKYNMTMGGVHYLIQENWVDAINAITGAKGYCALSY